MRRPGTFAASFAAALFLSVSPRAEGSVPTDIRFELLNADEKAIIDRIAADFFEHDLRATQSQAIEDLTAEFYRRANPADRAALRDARRTQWLKLSPGARAGLQRAIRPRYHNLTDAQKAPFRSHAINRLEAIGAIDKVAFAATLADGI